MAKKEQTKVKEQGPEKFTPAVGGVVQPIDTPQGKTIDERMADLLKDHQAMGARPK